MSIETTIYLNKFQPRDYQLPFCRALEGYTDSNNIYHKPYKKLMLVHPRRSGKDLVCFNLLFRQALKRVGLYIYVLPTFGSARRIIWDNITIEGLKLLDMLPKMLIDNRNEQLMRLRMVSGSIIQLLGSDSFDTTIVGSNPVGIVFSEMSLSDPRAYYLSRPILNANDGFCILNGTPRGHNQFYELFKIAKANPQEWFVDYKTIEDTKHISLELIQKEIDTGEVSYDLARQEYWCFPADQMVVGLNETKPINEFKEGELVITHTGRARKILKPLVRDYEGDLIEIKTYGSYETIKCTPEHPIRVCESATQTYSWKPAKDLTVNDYLVYPKMYLGKIPIISYELCMLLAWYISDGSTFNNGLQFCVNHEKAKRVTSLLNSLKIEFNQLPKDKVTYLTINSVQLVDFFRSACGNICYDKRIPFHLISGFHEDFFHELMKGDGCFNVRNGYRKFVFSTTSRHLAYQIQLLANSLNLGYAASISRRRAAFTVMPNGKSYPTRDSYSIAVSFNPTKHHDFKLIRAKLNVIGKIRSVSKSIYKGPVYNLNVMYDSSYLVSGRSVHNCDWHCGQPGAYYAKYIDKLRLEGRITTVPHESSFKVNTAWDLGVHDATCIIFWQQIGNSIRIIDCYTNTDKGLDHYAKVLNQKDYLYEYHVAPHDIAVRELGASGAMSRLETARNLGINFTIAPRLTLEDGIEAVRTSFSRIWIDEEKCQPLLKALTEYRREYDTKLKVYRDRPLHNWASNFADATRMMAISLEKTNTHGSLSPEQLERNYRNSRYGSQDPITSPFRDEKLTFY